MKELRRLILLRHAKSDWEDDSLHDHDRPLAQRGRDAAPRVGAWIARQGLEPDLVLCSSAQRTRETWERLAPALAGRPTLRIEPKLYLADSQAILAQVARAPSRARTLLVLGHNPGIQDTAVQLARRHSLHGDAPILARMRRKFPTGALACFSTSGDWHEVLEVSRLEHFLRPKDLRASGTAGGGIG